MAVEERHATPRRTPELLALVAVTPVAPVTGARSPSGSGAAVPGTCRLRSVSWGWLMAGGLSVAGAGPLGNPLGSCPAVPFRNTVLGTPGAAPSPVKPTMGGPKLASTAAP